jgi:hypothetical protein
MTLFYVCCIFWVAAGPRSCTVHEVGFSFVTVDMKCICLLVADIQEPGEVQE